LNCALYAALIGTIGCGGDDSATSNQGSQSGSANEGNAAAMEIEEPRPDQDGTESGNEPPAGARPSNTSAASIEASLLHYREWQPRTAAPVNVSSEIFTLCRSPTLSENAFVDSEHGESRMLMDWLNPAARAGFEVLGDQGFAPGAAIVKEKLSYREGGVEPELVAIGIMLKHEPGFDSENGDWEFAYWEEAPGLIDGPEQSAYCAACHASSATDFVFLDDSWRDSSAAE
jgi:hypothetical protein